MSEEKTVTENAELYAKALELVKTTKVDLAEAKASLRKFKKANKARKVEDLKDEKLKKEFATMEEAVNAAQTTWEEAKDASAELKPTKPRGGGGTYAYSEIKDQETGEMRMPSAKETKRWRTHARKVAKKEEILAKDVPFDPAFFDPKPAKKVKEEKVEAKADDKAADATEEKGSKRRSRKAKKED